MSQTAATADTLAPQAASHQEHQAKLDAMLKILAQAISTQQVQAVEEIASKLANVGLLPVIELFNACECLNQHQLPQQVLQLYKNWLGNTESPIAYAVWFNYGVSLANQQDLPGGEHAYRQAISLKPDFIEAHLNLGTLLEKLGRPEEALDTWRKVPTFGDPVADKALHVQAYNNLGRLLEILKRLKEAQLMLENALALDAEQSSTITHWVHIRQKQCEWPTYPPLHQISAQTLRENTSALALLSASDDPAVQLAAAQRFVKEKVSTNLPALAPKQGYAHQRLRIGYLSSDLCSHAVAILTAELYELHDRKRVEVYAFSWSREDGTPLRARVVKAFDHYIRIDKMTDLQAAECIRAHEIDILVDLHGLTSGTRPDIVSHRPAPVQATYLGFPGTCALPNIDYVLSDRFVLPEELTPFFSEKPAYLPRCFQINDRKREVGPKPSRQEAGLPEDKFVFCSFNNNFKFTPEMFACWMRILQRVPHAVLWLVADNEWVSANLHKQAEQHGVAAERIIFAPRVMPSQYLARYQVADLFLDTYPFNAGTTASDALWAGLPLLTYTGRTFASRMAGSLLQAVDLPDLITYSLADYEEKAVQLANDGEKIAAMKRQLQENRLSCILFDSPQFVRDLEDLYERLAVKPLNIENLVAQVASASTPAPASKENKAPLRSMKQTPINQVHNVDVLNMMQPNLRKVVEVGSSSGALAHAYRINNPNSEYIGIEIVEEYAEASRDYCTDVIYGDVEKLSDEEFARLADADCWIFADALEHLYDPWKLLQRIHAHKTGPVEIIACIPNAQNWGLQSCLNSGRFIYQNEGLLDRTHIRWFTRITINSLFASTGFQVVNMIARNFHAPSEAQTNAIKQMASAFGADPDEALADAIPFQYVVKAQFA